MARVNKSERERSPRTPDRDLAFARRMVIDITTPAYMIYKEVFKSLGSNVCCGVHACELKKDPIIKAMMEDTRKTVREEFMVTVESLIAELEEARQVGAKTESAGPMVAATMGKAKLAGLDKQIIDHTSSDGSMRPNVIQLVGPDDDDSEG